MIGLPLILAAALPFAAPPSAVAQGSAGGVETGSGVEGVLGALRDRSTMRRDAARAAWEQHGSAYLEEPGAEERIAPLLEHAPEIQEAVLRELRNWLAAEEPDPARGDALLQLLGRTMSAAGADRLAALLPELPSGQRQSGLLFSVSRGGIRGVQIAERWLRGGSVTERQTAIDALLRHGEASRAAAWLAQVPVEDVDPAVLGAALGALAQRAELPQEFQVPEALLRDGPPAFRLGVLQLLAARPVAQAESYAGAIAVLRSEDAEVRRAALTVLEAGAEPFRWRAAPKDLADFLDTYPTDPLAEDVAWALHRMGHRDGARYLVAGPEAALRANPKDYRARMRLGRTYVELGKFRDAYKEYRTAIQDIEGTQSYRNVDALNWLFAARAAAGARRYSDGAEWLEQARMSPKELEPYRDLPEFQGALNKPAFRRLFGLE